MTCAVDLCSLCADNIHSDRCRVPLNPVLCLTAATSSRSLWTATHTRWWQRWAWFEVSCLRRCSCIKETAAEISQAASPCLLVSITHTVASSARRERTQQRHLQDGLGHTTPVMFALLWCRLCWADDKARRCDVLLSGFYPAPAVFFFVSYGERLTRKQEMSLRLMHEEAFFRCCICASFKDGPGLFHGHSGFLPSPSQLRLVRLLPPLMVL